MAKSPNRNDGPASWDRMNTFWFRYWTIYEEKGKTLKNEEEKKKHREEFQREVHFFIKGSCDLEFRQYLEKQLDYTKERGRKEGVVISKHIKELTRFILLDKIMERDGKFLTTQDMLPPKKHPKWWRELNSEHAESETDDNDENENLSYGHLHRIVNEYYPELITKRIELRNRLGRRKYSNQGRRTEDHKKRIVETQFSQDETVPPGLFQLVVARAMGKDATPKFYERLHMQEGEVTKAMSCDPIHLAKLLTFRKQILEIIEEFDTNPFSDEENKEKERFEETGLFNYLVEALFLQVKTLVELRWFRGKSEDIQRRIIFRDSRQPKYYRRYAKIAVGLNLEWLNDSETVLTAMYTASLSYIQYLKVPMPQVGLFLMQECLEQLDLSDDLKALITYNISMSYQALQNHDLMLEWLNKAKNLWEKIGDHPGDLADIYGYIAEYWRLRDYKKYLCNRDKAEELLKSDILTKRRKAFHCLFLSNCACMFKDIDWEKLLYELGLMLSGSDDNLEDFASFFNQCLEDLKDYGHRGPEGGPGRYAPPREWDETVSSPSFKTTFLDPRRGN